MATAPNPAFIFSCCSLWMASLFAYSAFVQINDPDWYFWIPLYLSASLVNLQNSSYISQISNKIAKFAFVGGVLLFLKVVSEAYMYGLARFWSLDLRQRVVREKMGSGLVVVSMILQLMAFSVPNDPKRKKREIGNYAALGMALLVIVSLGLSFAFFALVKDSEVDSEVLV